MSTETISASQTKPEPETAAEGDRARPVRAGRPRPRPDGRRHGRPEGRHVLALARAAARAGCAPSAHKAYAVLVLTRAQRHRHRRSARGSSAGRPTWSSPASSAGRLPAGTTQEPRPSRRCGARARTSSPTCSRRWTSYPARASTSRAVGRRAAGRARRSTSPRRCWRGSAATSSTTSCRAPCCRMRSDVEDKVNRLPLGYFDQQPRGELLSRVTNDIDNVSQTLQQTMSQLLTSLLTVVARAGDDVLDLAAAGAGRAGLGADLDVRDRRGHEALAGACSSSSGGAPARSTRTSRRPSPATRWSRSSAGSTRPSGCSPSRTTSSTRRRSAPSSSAA